MDLRLFSFTFGYVSVGRKVPAALIAAAVIAAAAALLWPSSYRYQGRSVEAWFKDCAKDKWVEDYASTGEIGQSGAVFRLMDTNVVPFLASRITRDLSPSRFERWTSKLPARFHRTSKEDEAITAALLLSKCVKAPESMLRELLKPAMHSTNEAQSIAVEIVLGVSVGSLELDVARTRPASDTTQNSLAAVVTVLEPSGSRTVWTTNSDRISMIKDWLQDVNHTQPPVEKIGAVAPWCTVMFYAGSKATATNVVFSIDGRTTREELLTDKQRQKLIRIIDGK